MFDVVRTNDVRNYLFCVVVFILHAGTNRSGPAVLIECAMRDFRTATAEKFKAIMKNPCT